MFGFSGKGSGLPGLGLGGAGLAALGAAAAAAAATRAAARPRGPSTSRKNDNDLLFNAGLDILMGGNRMDIPIGIARELMERKRQADEQSTEEESSSESEQELEIQSRQYFHSPPGSSSNHQGSSTSESLTSATSRDQHQSDSTHQNQSTSQSQRASEKQSKNNSSDTNTNDTPPEGTGSKISRYWFPIFAGLFFLCAIRCILCIIVSVILCVFSASNYWMYYVVLNWIYNSLLYTPFLVIYNALYYTLYYGYFYIIKPLLCGFIALISFQIVNDKFHLM